MGGWVGAYLFLSLNVRVGLRDDEHIGFLEVDKDLGPGERRRVVEQPAGQGMVACLDE